ncbi:MAG: hypothetical protein COU28_00885 [Candidatus Magasanikbacteria bacterium CG10_big_fil_rev_8_21_14_0_10_36_16]|uniref:Uncharacterized protein n=1 Tax=Candidatus Magasanikbacteria bacterium CG10_big_fil_rev_8_21_14_0_10_36_16 TaxID=1974645 RepID=A0A2H0TZC0_9BACT|nr:MAG: hypothetical protein COU28_00885 [Candidatus Magasanikbacteria bacterium CG10_big_fil_rev_8_21_14_0_10_36_16]
MSLISSYLLALFLTMVIELGVALFLGFRKKIEIIAIIFVNLLTNPILNYLLLVNNHFSFFKTNLLIILLLELLVVLAEWKLLLYIIQDKSSKIFKLSFVMNFCSYIVGVIIFR